MIKWEIQFLKSKVKAPSSATKDSKLWLEKDPSKNLNKISIEF